MRFVGVIWRMLGLIRLAYFLKATSLYYCSLVFGFQMKKHGTPEFNVWGVLV